VPQASLLSWNVAGRVRRMPEQAQRIAAAAPDLVCLQEVSPATAARWTEALSAAGLRHVAIADRAAAAEAGRRPLCTLTAARGALQAEAGPAVPYPERVLATRSDGLEVVNVHSPISPRPNLAKVLTHESVHQYVARRSGPRIVCGDLNTPRKEHPDGRVWTFARTSHGNLRRERGRRWDEAELALIKGLEPYGFRDAFRERHGLEVRELSWEWARWGGGYRLDHLIASREVAVTAIGYRHGWRTDGLSDHSPLLAELAWPDP
jgi:exonuclease III